MKKTSLVLLSFLFVGLTPSDQQWTVVLLDGTEYSSVSLLRLDGDSLVATTEGDTLFLPVAQISEIFTSSHPLGIPGSLVGAFTGAAIAAGCVVASEASGEPEEGLKKVAIVGYSALGAGVGAVAGCLLLPEKETRYDLEGKILVVKKSMISSILSRQAVRRE